MLKNQNPIIKSGNVAVWPAKELDSGHKLYTVSFEKANDERNYVMILANIAGYELNPREILSLSCGQPVKIEDQNQYGPKICTIVNRCLLSILSEKNNNAYFNHMIALDVAYHRIGASGYTYGYICNGVSFNLHSIDPESDQDIYLSPKDCFDLLEGKTIAKDNLKAFLHNIAEVKSPSKQDSFVNGQFYMTARLQIQKIAFDNPFYLRKHSEAQALEEAIKRLK